MDSANEVQTKKSVCLIVAAVAVAVGGAIVIAVLANKRKNNLIQQPNLPTPTQPTPIEDTSFLLINVGPPDQQNEDLKANDELAKYILENHAHRFIPKRWQCIFCNKDISPGRSFYRCGDCDLFVACDRCYIIDSEEQKNSIRTIHQQLQEQTNELVRHDDEFIFFIPYQKQPNRFAIACATQVDENFTYFKDRLFIGEKYKEGSNLPATKNRKGKLVFQGFEWFTYEQVYNQIKQFAAGLKSLGVNNGDCVAICSDNRLEWAITDFCCLRQGIVSAAMNTALTAQEYYSILKELSVKTVVCSAKVYDRIAAAIMLLNEENIDSMKFIVLMDPIPEENGIISLPDTVPCYLFDFILDIGSREIENVGEPPVNRLVPSSSTIAINFTSGSTGCPKAVLFNENKWRDTMSHVFPFRNTVLYGYLPMDHMAGRADLYTAFSNGGRIAFPRTDSVENQFFEDARILRPTAFGLIPLICNIVHQHFNTTLQKQIEANPNLPKELIEQQLKDNPEFKYVFGNRISSVKISTAPISVEVVRFLRGLLRVRVNTGYGSTEVGSITYNNQLTQPIRLVSVPELGYYITNNPPQGEIYVKNLRMDKYSSDKENQSRFTDGWFATGDIGEQTGPSQVHVIDRISNIIKLSNGEFVAVEKLEKIFIQSIYISQIYIYADSFKSDIVAVVLPNKDVAYNNDIIMNDFFRLAKDNALKKFQVPVAVYIDENLAAWTPSNNLLTGSNKLCRRNLKKHYASFIDQLYIKLAMNAILDQNADSTKSFRQLGGSSIEAVQLVERLKQNSIHISFEDLMGNSNIDSLSSSTNMPKFVIESNDSQFSTKEEIQQIDDFMNDGLVSEIRHFNETYVHQAPKHIFLTGGTGFLGSDLLEGLLSEYPTAIIHCLCRNSQSFDELNNERIVPIVGDLSKPYFGLFEDAFRKLAETIDLILHCGAVVNHLVSLKDLYKTNVSSIYDVLTLATQHHIKPLHYVSSVSALVRKPSTSRGYGSSKWIVDKILQHAKEKYNFPVFIYRPSLIIGNRINGKINHRDWFHRFLAAVVQYKIVPPVPQNMPINMIALDYCSSVILELIKANPPPATEYQFNICQQNCSWQQIIEMLLAVAPFITQLKTHGEWFTQIKAKVGADHPFAPFIDHFEHSLDTQYSHVDNSAIYRVLSEDEVPLIHMRKEDVQLLVNELQQQFTQ